jgi:hypothetical protein
LTTGVAGTVDLSGFHAGMSVAASSVGSIVNLAGAGTGDKVSFGVSTGQTAGALGAAANVTAATSVENAVGLAAAAATATHEVVWFKMGSDSYFVGDTNASASYTAADTIVKVVGVTDLSHAKRLSMRVNSTGPHVWPRLSEARRPSGQPASRVRQEGRS